jgi:hypothetical protein
MNFIAPNRRYQHRFDPWKIVLELLLLTALVARPRSRLRLSVPWRFFRTAAGAGIDLLLEIPAHGLWAIEIKRSLSGRPGKGFYIACEDLRPDRRFVVNSDKGNYPIDSEITAIGVHELAEMLADLSK